MARLPVPGSDNGVWGTLLNDFLSVEHNSDGTLKSNDLIAAKVAKGELVYNVKDYGAKGDGGTNDTTAILATITAATAADGATVYFPTGVYMTTGIGVSGKSNFTLMGVGKASVVKLLSGNTSNNIRVTNCTNFTVTDLTFDCNRSAQTQGTDEDLQCGVHLVGCSAFMLRGVRAINSYMSGIRLGLFPADQGGCVDGAITNCYINLGNNADQGIGIWNSQRITVTNCNVQAGGWGGIVLTRSDYCTVTGNTSYNNVYTIDNPTNGGHGIALEGARWCTVAGNTCYNNNVYGIHLEVDPQTSARDVLDCTITGNACYGNIQGIFLGRARLITISANTVTTNTQSGIELSANANNCVVQGNVSNANAEIGVWVKASNSQVVGNLTRDNGAQGMLMQTVSNVLFANNQSLSNVSSGFDIRGTTNCSVTGNTARDNGTQGFIVQKDGSVANTMGALSNNISSNNTNEGFIILTAAGFTISGNFSSANRAPGMDLRGLQYSAVTGNVVINNGTVSSHQPGIQLKDDGSAYCLNNTFTGNNSSDNQSTHTQTRGIEELGNSNRNIFTSNVCLNNTDGQISTVGAGSITANNITA